MHRNEQVRLLRELMKHLDEGTNVDAGGLMRNPSEAYTCPELAAREWEHFFRAHPQIVGMSADLPDPGSFITCDDFGVPVLATRGKDGEFRAFVNVCRHRGAILEPQARGDCQAFSCPFHGWTYAHDGKLAGLPKSAHFGRVDAEKLGLIALPAREAYGFLFVHPDPQGSLDPAQLLGDLAPELESWNWQRLIHRANDTYAMGLNWKLAMDTFGETYHFPVLHKNTLAPVFHGNVQCYDTFGRNHRMLLCKRDIDLLRGRPEATWHITDGAFPVYYLFPNVQLNVGNETLTVVRAYPDPENPGRSISRVSFYCTPESLTAGEAQMAGFFGEIIRDEDYAVAATSQRGAETGLQSHVLFGRNEPALHHYHNTYREALGMEPLPLLSEAEATA